MLNSNITATISRDGVLHLLVRLRNYHARMRDQHTLNAKDQDIVIVATMNRRIAELQFLIDNLDSNRSFSLTHADLIFFRIGDTRVDGDAK